MRRLVGGVINGLFVIRVFWGRMLM